MTLPLEARSSFQAPQNNTLRVSFSDAEVPGRTWVKNSVKPDVVVAAQAGDADAFGKIYEVLFSPVQYFATSRLNNLQDAEDLASQVFLKLAEGGLGKYEPRPGVTFESWLYKIARNEITDRIRKVNVSKEEELLPTLALKDDPLEKVNDTIDAQLLLRRAKDARDQLPPDQKKVFGLRVWEGLSVKDVASITNKTENNVKVLQHKARQKMRARVGISVA